MAWCDDCNSDQSSIEGGRPADAIEQHTIVMRLIRRKSILCVIEVYLISSALFLIEY